MTDEQNDQTEPEQTDTTPPAVAEHAAAAAAEESAAAERTSDPEGPQGITTGFGDYLRDAPSWQADEPAPSPGPESTELADLKAENARLSQQLAQSDAQNRAPRAHQQDEPAELVPLVVEDADDLETLGTRAGLTGDEVYARNHRTIENEATARGFASSEQGRLLFPGTVLYVPPSD